MSNDTAAYVVDWLKKLRDDRRLRRHAAAQARHAADYILRAPHTVGKSAAPAMRGRRL